MVNKCLCCNGDIFGLVPCNCEKSKENVKLWDRELRKSGKKCKKGVKI